MSYFAYFKSLMEYILWKYPLNNLSPPTPPAIYPLNNPSYSFSKTGADVGRILVYAEVDVFTTKPLDLEFF